MKTQAATRREFLGGMAAALAATSLIRGNPARAGGHLDTTYCRTEPPYLCVDYPSSWYVTEELLTDLIDPIQLLHVSNASIDAHHSQDSGFPDLSLLPVDAALLAIRASQFDPESEVVFRDGSQGIGGWNLETVNVEGSDVASLMAWYRMENIIYELYLWIGPSYQDWSTLQAVVQSLRISTG